MTQKYYDEIEIELQRIMKAQRKILYESHGYVESKYPDGN